MAAPMTSIVSRHVRRFFVPNKANKVLLPATFFFKRCITSGTDTENNTNASKDSTKRIDKDDLRENAFEAGATEDLVHASHADANEKIGDINGRGLQRQSGSTDQSGLEKAFAMFDRLGSVSGEDMSTRENIPDHPFASLLRNSKLMQIGDPEGRIVVGTIIETIEDDLYIDYGGKFHCVVKRPRTRQQEYHRGVKVRLRLQDLELSSFFMGASQDITLLESDAVLMGIHREKERVSETFSSVSKKLHGFEEKTKTK